MHAASQFTGGQYGIPSRRCMMISTFHRLKQLTLNADRNPAVIM